MSENTKEEAVQIWRPVEKDIAKYFTCFVERTNVLKYEYINYYNYQSDFLKKSH